MDELTLDQEVFDKELIRHKKQISRLGIKLRENPEMSAKEMNSLFTPAKRSGRELALVCANFKCEKTGDKKDLQFHHLVGRQNKKIMAFNKYATQRNYWANIVVLSQEQHRGNSSKDYTISDKLINKIKRKYFK